MGVSHGELMTEPNFADKTIWTGDNLDILRGMNSECVDLIYLDPPFNSNQNYAAPVGSKAAGAAFKDTWSLSDLDVAWMGLIADEQPATAHVLKTAGVTHGKRMQSYLTMMAVRLMEMRRVLKPTGSIYLHCDPYASHYLKMLMDAVFGAGSYRNEIIWRYKKYQKANMRYFTRNSDRILYYLRSSQSTYNPVFEKLKTPKRYLKREWDKATQRIVNSKDEYGRVQYMTVDQEKVDDVWALPYLMPAARERIGFPTQKPLALLERIIKASSNEGDVVLDPFCGCATACVADKLNRKWVGIDISPKAVELVNMRLQQAMGSLFHHRYVTARTDIPRRTDIEAHTLPPEQARPLRAAGRTMRRMPGGLPLQALRGRPRDPAVQGRHGPPREPATTLLKLQPHQGRQAPGVPGGETKGNGGAVRGGNKAWYL